MKLLVIGAGMMGSAAAYDMARQAHVSEVTLADSDAKRVKDAVARVNKLAGGKKVKGASVDASNPKKAAKLMKGHDGVLSAVPYFFNLGLAKAAIESKCHFADLGGEDRGLATERAEATSEGGWARHWEQDTRQAHCGHCER